MKFKLTNFIITATLASLSGHVMAIPALPETCVGSPWAVCWHRATPPGMVSNTANIITVKTLNGQTYNNVTISWASPGANPVPTVLNTYHCTTSTATSVSGCTIFPDTAETFTGAVLTGVTEGQFLTVTVSRQNANGSDVNLVQTRIGPFIGSPV